MLYKQIKREEEEIDEELGTLKKRTVPKNSRVSAKSW